MRSASSSRVTLVGARSTPTLDHGDWLRRLNPRLIQHDINVFF
jgi:hypothetical protein